MSDLLPCPFCGSAAKICEDEEGYFCVACMGECFSCTEPHGEPEHAADTWNQRTPDPALLALARFGAEVLCESTDYCGSFACGLSMAALEHIALAGPVLDFPDVGSPTIRPGIASAIARLLAPDGTESEVAP